MFWEARVYRALLFLLPARIREADGEEIALTMEDLLDEAPGGGARFLIFWRGLRRMPWLLMREWFSHSLPQGRHASTQPATPEQYSIKRLGKGGWRMEIVIKQIRYGVRSLAKTGGFTWAAVLLLGLGVGAVTGTFTVVDHVLLRPLPYPAQDRLVYMTNGSHSGPALRRLDGVDAFEMWAAASDSEVNLTRPDGEPLELTAIEVTSSFFTMFGGRPAVGSLLTAGHDDNPGVAVLTHESWVRIWGADPGVVGTTLSLNGEPVEVLGVLSEDFTAPSAMTGRSPDLFKPMMWSNPDLQDPGYHAHSVTARLAQDQSIEVGDAQLDELALELMSAYPDYYGGEPDDWPLVSLREQTTQRAQGGLVLLLSAVGLLLLVACANVAHLFMARGLARGREMAIRRALGAGSGDLTLQLLAESLLVGLSGGVVGLALAEGALRTFGQWTNALPRGEAITLDLRVLLFTVLLSTLTAVLFGLIPALRTVASGDLRQSLGASGRSSSGSRTIVALRNGLIVGEVAVSLVLVALSGLLLRSFLEVTGQDLGIEVADVWVAPMNLSGIDAPEDYLTRLEPVRRDLSALPGVEAVTYGFEAPFQWVGGQTCCQARSLGPTDSDERVRTLIHSVSQGYFETFGTELVAGRNWTQDEATRSPPALVVSEGYAVWAFGSAEAAVGQTVTFSDEMVQEIVGVAEATLHYGPDQPHDYAIYRPIEAMTFPAPFTTIGVRVGPGVGPEFGQRLRQAIWSIEPNQPLPTVVPLEQWISEASAVRRFGARLIVAFGVTGLLLAAGGLYGTLLYNVSQQRKELGIRLALGAPKERIQARVVARGLIQVSAGIALGLVVALALGRVVEAFLFGVTARDPVSLVAATLILTVTAVVASWLPAVRASSTDPLETLTAE